MNIQMSDQRYAQPGTNMIITRRRAGTQYLPRKRRGRYRRSAGAAARRNQREGRRRKAFGGRFERRPIHGVEGGEHGHPDEHVQPGAEGPRGSRLVANDGDGGAHERQRALYDGEVEDVLAL